MFDLGYIRRSEVFEMWEKSSTDKSFKTWLAEVVERNPSFDTGGFDPND
jgi:hypothetical protein